MRIKSLRIRSYKNFKVSEAGARRFLFELLKALPFPLRSIQMDDGSEFMADFETCQDLGIALYMLPPRRPQYNDCVERANRSARIEFWGRYDGPLQAALDGYEFFYSYQRSVPKVLNPYNSLTGVDRRCTLRL